MDGLRLVFVNHCHPEMVHVCRLRARLCRGHDAALATRCDSVTELARGLGEAWSSDAFAPPERDRMARYSWDTQAAVLERVPERVVG